MRVSLAKSRGYKKTSSQAYYLGVPEPTGGRQASPIGPG